MLILIEMHQYHRLHENVCAHFEILAMLILLAKMMMSINVWIMNKGFYSAFCRKRSLHMTFSGLNSDVFKSFFILISTVSNVSVFTGHNVMRHRYYVLHHVFLIKTLFAAKKHRHHPQCELHRWCSIYTSYWTHVWRPKCDDILVVCTLSDLNPKTSVKPRLNHTEHPPFKKSLTRPDIELKWNTSWLR